MQKNILIVDPGFRQGKEPYLQHLMKLPYNFYLAINGDQRLPLEPYWEDYFPKEKIFSLNFRNLQLSADQLIRVAEERGITFQGIYTYYEDSICVTHALNDAMHTAKMVRGDIAPLRDKALMRQALTAGGVKQPRFQVCNSPEEAMGYIKEFGLPCIMKPAQMMGSVGVTKISSFDVDQIRKAFADAYEADIEDEDTVYAYAIERKVIVEQYIPADFELSCECVVKDQRLISWAPTRKLLGAEPHFFETGHIHPAQLSPMLSQKIEETLKRAVDALSIDNSVLHAELRVKHDSPVIVEIGTRAAGDLIPFIVMQAGGIDLLAAGVQLSLGEDVLTRSATAEQVSFIYFLENNFTPPAAQSLQNLHIHMYSEPTEGRYGHIIGTAPDEMTALNIIEKLKANVAR